MGALSDILEYSNAIVNGDIIACKKHIWACQRFIDDIHREQTDAFPWGFDESRAEKYFKWMELFKHEKGSLAGEKKIPVPYEKFVYGNLYGWVHRKTELRRFRRSYEQLARKQAKSQDKGIQALYEISQMGENSAEAYVAATKKEQTRFVWGSADWLYKNGPCWLRNMFETKHDQQLLQVVIKHKSSGSFISRLSKDDKKSGDGTNPHFMVLDEYHLQEDTFYYDLATSGMKTRKQPLLSIITTAGFDLNKPCYRVEYPYVTSILDPDSPVTNERYFAIICELESNTTSEPVVIKGKKYKPGEMIDDINDETLWIKASPVTGDDETYRESVRIEVDEANDKPEKMRDVKTKTFDIWINEQEAGYMNMVKWAACKSVVGVDLTKCPCFPGLDLSEIDDLTSVNFEFIIGYEEYYLLSHSFIPADRVREKIEKDKIRYDLWIDKGLITATPGPVIDYHIILNYIKDQFKKNGWQKDECCFDRAKASWLMAEIERADFKAVDVPQNFNHLSEPIKNFRYKVKEKKIHHDGNPVLTWAVGNAVLRVGPSGNVLLDKTKSKFKIDPITAAIISHYRAMVHGKEHHIYNERGMRDL